MGVYAHAVIKKRRYWPKYCDGDIIDEHITDKKVGEVDVATGIIDDIKFNLFAMKESERRQSVQKNTSEEKNGNFH